MNITYNYKTYLTLTVYMYILRTQLNYFKSSHVVVYF